MSKSATLKTKLKRKRSMNKQLKTAAVKTAKDNSLSLAMSLTANDSPQNTHAMCGSQLCLICLIKRGLIIKELQFLNPSSNLDVKIKPRMYTLSSQFYTLHMLIIVT